MRSAFDLSEIVILSAKYRLLASALLLLPLCACTGNAGRAEQNPQPSAGAPPIILNADEYRQEIMEIDRLVFEPQPLDGARRELLATTLEQLARRVKAAGDSPLLSIEAMETNQLAGIVRNLPDKASRMPLWDNWMRIRNNLFDDRAWFARSAADLPPLPEAAPPGGEEPKTAAEPAPSPAPVAIPSRRTLEGRWRLAQMFSNGRLTDDPELSGTVWTFEGDQLVIHNPKGETRGYTYNKVQDEQGTALHLQSHSSNPPPAESGWMIYELGDAGLQIAFYDGLGDRPEGFVPRPGRRDPMLIVVVLRPEP
jgi:uncharacterized protein (TIGR03067 family)